MTRINVIPIEELTREHLQGEYKEIVRVVNLSKNYYKRLTAGKKVSKIPVLYTLGTGHVTFFYDKLSYIIKRYYALAAEMTRRGYKPVPVSCLELLQDIPLQALADYVPTPEAVEINRQRIQERSK